MTKTRRAAARRARKPRSQACLPWALALSVLCCALLLVGLLALSGLVAGLAGSEQASPGGLTLLIMGVDRRADESTPSRSDAMILAGFSQRLDQAVLLSIPRDLWVSIPGVGDQRINTALVFGHDSGDPEAGPRLAKRTVAEQFNLPVDRYLILDFQTFERVVDALGGIQVDVPRPLTDSQYPTSDYGVTTIHFDAGLQAMNGQQALIYVRTRHADSDFDRSLRQLQVLSAIAVRVGHPAAWPRLPGVIQAMMRGIQTDLRALDLPALLPMMVALAQGRLTMGRLDGAETQPWITPAGAWVLLPNWPAIQHTVLDLFGQGP